MPTGQRHTINESNETLCDIMQHAVSRITGHGAGTECYDWSTFGTRRQLEGPTARSLAIYLAHSIFMSYDVAVHVSLLGF